MEPITLPARASVPSGYHKILGAVKRKAPIATSWGWGDADGIVEMTKGKLLYCPAGILPSNDDGTLQQKTEARPVLTLPHFLSLNRTYSLNLLLNAARPIRPEPRRSIVPGSGTEAGVSTSEMA
jgi:hypothetical protein